jgi:hypothetical protein
VAATEKKSFSIDRAEMRWLASYSKRNRISASSAVSLAIRLLREQETARKARERAAKAFLSTFSKDEHATPEEQNALLSKWRG